MGVPSVQLAFGLIVYVITCGAVEVTAAELSRSVPSRSPPSAVRGEHHQRDECQRAGGAPAAERTCAVHRRNPAST
jgi:hypothetical protein